MSFGLPRAALATCSRACCFVTKSLPRVSVFSGIQMTFRKLTCSAAATISADGVRERLQSLWLCVYFRCGIVPSFLFIMHPWNVFVYQWCFYATLTMKYQKTPDLLVKVRLCSFLQQAQPRWAISHKSSEKERKVHKKCFCDLYYDVKQFHLNQRSEQRSWNDFTPLLFKLKLVVDRRLKWEKNQECEHIQGYGRDRTCGILLHLL